MTQDFVADIKSLLLGLNEQAAVELRYLSADRQPNICVVVPAELVITDEVTGERRRSSVVLGALSTRYLCRLLEIAIRQSEGSSNLALYYLDHLKGHWGKTCEAYVKASVPGPVAQFEIWFQLPPVDYPTDGSHIGEVSTDVVLLLLEVAASIAVPRDYS